MPRRKSATFTDREFTFMTIIWGRGEVTADDIQKELERHGSAISSGSIRNILAIMMNKGYIGRRQEGKGYYYHAAIEKNDARRSMLRHLIDKVFDGSESQAVAALLDRGTISRKELDTIRRLIDET